MCAKVKEIDPFCTIVIQLRDVGMELNRFAYLEVKS